MRKILVLLLLMASTFYVSGQVYVMSELDGQTIEACSDDIVLGNYLEGDIYTVTVCSDDDIVQHVRFFLDNFFYLPYGTTLCVYDGESQLSPMLTCYDYNTMGNLISVSATASNPTGCLTLVFTGGVQNASFSGSFLCSFLCQSRTVDFVSASPVIQEDGYINVCWDDETNSTMPIEFTAQGIYPELPYQCNDSTNRFYWNFGDGTPIISGLGLSTVTHNFDQRKGYSVYLTIRDSMGCYNSNSAKQFVRVSLAPTFDQVSTGLFINPPSESPTICMGQEVEACAYFSSSHYSEDCNNTVGDTLPIPDNALECLESNAFIDCYAPGQLITNTISMPKTHMNLAHSYLADLKIYISCPNGQQVQLCAQGGGGCYLGDPGQNHQISNDDSGFWYIIGQGGTQTMQQAAIGNSTLPSGLYASYQSLTGLVGCPLNGTWKLRICDQFEYDAGTLFGWWIEFDSTLTPEYLHYTQNYSTLGWSGAYGSTFSSEINQNCVTGSYLNTANSEEDTFQPFAFSVIDNFGCIHDTVMTLTVLASSNQECCIFPNTFAGFDEYTCGYSYNLSASLTTGNHGMWSVAEGPGQVTFTDFENPTTDVTVFPDGDYLFVWKEFYQENTSCFTTDTVLIHFNPSLSPIIAPIDDVCAGSNSFQIGIEAIGELTCVPENGSFNNETGVFNPTIPDNYTITNSIYDPCQGEIISYSESFVIKNKAVIVNFEENCVEIIPDSLAVQVTFEVVDVQNIAYQDFLINNTPVTEASSFDTIIPSATNYSFTLTDINGCTNQTIEGIRDCSCPLYAGTFEIIDLITMCENECLGNLVVHNSDQNTENGAAIFEFIIHSGDYIPLITSNSPTFCFDNEQLNYNTIYYLTAVCGYPDFENHPDLNNSCHSLSQSVPVMWIQLPTLTAGEDIDTCGKIIQITSNASDEDYYGFWTSDCDVSTLSGYTFFTNNTWIESQSFTECNFVRTISNGICSLNDSVIVNFNQVPQPFAGQDFTTCGLHTILSGATSIYESDYFWSAENLAFSDTNNLESDLTATFEGTFEVILTEIFNGCQNTDNVLVTFLHELDIWTTPDTDYVCDTSANIEVFGDFYGGNWNVYYHNTVLEPTFDYEFSPNNSSQSIEFIFDDLPQGVNNLMLDFVWNGINPYSGTDCETTVTKTIVFSRTPVANAGESEFISVCDNCVSLDADTTGFSWAQYYWVPNINGQFINSYSSPQTDFCIPMYELIEEDTINARFLWVARNGNCLDIDTLRVLFNRPAETPICPENIYLSQSEPFQLNGATPENGTYSGEGVFDNIYYPGNGSGEYTIQYTITNPNGCQDSCSFLINLLVENEQYLTNNFVISPNPNDGNFKINLENAIDVRKIEILNSAGAVVFVEYYDESIGNSMEIDASLVPGLYILRLIGADKAFMNKMVIEY